MLVCHDDSSSFHIRHFKCTRGHLVAQVRCCTSTLNVLGDTVIMTSHVGNTLVYRNMFGKKINLISISVFQSALSNL